MTYHRAFPILLLTLNALSVADAFSLHINANASNWFSVLYRTRIRVNKGETPIVNLSLLFCILAVLSAPWLAAAGVIAAILMGYQFSIQKNAPGCIAHDLVKVAAEARNVKSAVDQVSGDAPSSEE